MAARLKENTIKKVVPALTKEFGYKNVMAVPKIEKISLNIGLGEATQNAKLIDGAVNELSQIAGQKP
jgi:large subunit ribosomal protein L5